MTGGPATRRLDRLTWPDVRDAAVRGAAVVLPVGATEQHGYHLPLNTDAVLAERLALAVAQDVGSAGRPADRLRLPLAAAVRRR